MVIQLLCVWSEASSVKKKFRHNCIKVAELYQSYQWLIFVYHVDMACLPLILMNCFPQVCCISSAISESLGSAVGKWFRIYEEICSLPSGNVHRMVIWQHGAEVDPYCWKYGVFFQQLPFVEWFWTYIWFQCTIQRTLLLYSVNLCRIHTQKHDQVSTVAHHKTCDYACVKLPLVSRGTHITAPKWELVVHNCAH